MLNRINQLFQDSPKNLLSIYFCAGCPTLDGTADVIRALERNGVSMIEIGIPFSDPMADGIVIQNAATRSLHNGMSLRLLFEQLRDIRRDVRIPLVLMGYLNPIMQFGFEAFCQKCVECGIDGVIIPDLPFRDYEESYKAIASKYDIRVIMLITPETSEARVREIAFKMLRYRKVYIAFLGFRCYSQNARVYSAVTCVNDDDFFCCRAENGGGYAAANAGGCAEY